MILCDPGSKFLEVIHVIYFSVVAHVWLTHITESVDGDVAVGVASEGPVILVILDYVFEPVG